jgi:hypothetical protein
MNFIFAENPGRHRLNYQNALQNPSVDEWNPEE